MPDTVVAECHTQDLVDRPLMRQEPELEEE
jgi:hypothetical protein